MAIALRRRKIGSSRAGIAPLSVVIGPVAVAEVGDHRGQTDGDHLGGDRLGLQHPDASGTRVPQHVEGDELDGDARETDDAELRRLGDGGSRARHGVAHSTAETPGFSCPRQGSVVPAARACVVSRHLAASQRSQRPGAAFRATWRQPTVGPPPGRATRHPPSRHFCCNTPPKSPCVTGRLDEAAYVEVGRRRIDQLLVPHPAPGCDVGSGCGVVGDHLDDSPTSTSAIRRANSMIGPRTLPAQAVQHERRLSSPRPHRRARSSATIGGRASANASTSASRGGPGQPDPYVAVGERTHRGEDVRRGLASWRCTPTRWPRRSRPGRARGSASPRRRTSTLKVSR